MKFTEEFVMCTEKHVFIKKIFTNGLSIGWPLQIEQRSVIKILLAKKCKPCDIYRRMSNGNRETYFSKKIFTNGLRKHGFATLSLSQTCWFSSKEKVQVWQSIKKVMIIVFWDMKRLIIIDFLGKGAIANNASNYKLLRQNSLYLLDDIYIYIYVYLGSISSLMQISLNIIDILCLHILFWIRSNSRITFIVFRGNWLRYCP